jgi:hypothetical protein
MKLDLHVSAPVFVGGGTVEGFAKLTVDENDSIRHRRTLRIGALSVDLLGYEEVGNHRRATFLALGTDLIDLHHPPPPGMVHPSSIDDNFWSLTPSSSALPFIISLPLDTGPPPFHSKHASIRFILSATALIRDSGKLYRVRTSQDIHVLPTYDPEKALTSLPSPLTASDEISMGMETLRVTAGLHRQVWVSGSSIFVDVHIINKWKRPVKKLDLILERAILCYKHVAAATLEKSAGQARIFESNEQSILTKSSFKTASEIPPHTSDTRTCELELPRGHGTVRCGKYFEVRYFLNIIAFLSNSKLVSIQLPIILIHMNSLDVVPNSVAQVAAAIEEKRSRKHSFNLTRKPSFAQGRAFAAPIQQSLERSRDRRADIEDLRATLDASPRKIARRLGSVNEMSTSGWRSMGFSSAGKGKSIESLGVLGGISYSTPPNRGRRMRGDQRGESSRREDQGREESSTAPNPAPSNSLRDRLRRVGSATESQETNHRPPPFSTSSRITPHALGLTRKESLDAPPSERSNETLGSFRETLDRRRREFQQVRRKASGGLGGWWGQVRQQNKGGGSEGEREGWF